MRIIIYARVSTTGQGISVGYEEEIDSYPEQKFSLSAQAHICVNYIRKFVPDYQPFVFEDINSVYRNPNYVLRALMEELAPGDHIVFYAFDRITRNLDDGEYLWNLAKQKNLTLHVADNDYVSTNDNSYHIFAQGIVGAHNESKNLGSRISMVNRFRASLGDVRRYIPGYTKKSIRVESNGNEHVIHKLQPMDVLSPVLLQLIDALVNRDSPNVINGLTRQFNPNIEPVTIINKEGNISTVPPNAISATEIFHFFRANGIVERYNLELRTLNTYVTFRKKELNRYYQPFYSYSANKRKRQHDKRKMSLALEKIHKGFRKAGKKYTQEELLQTQQFREQIRRQENRQKRGFEERGEGVKRLRRSPRLSPDVEME